MPREREPRPPGAVVALLLTLAAGTVAAPGALAADDALERHRPVLRYDSDETHRAIDIEPLIAASTVERADGRVVRGLRARDLGARYPDGHAADGGDRLRFDTDIAGPPAVYGRRARDGSGRTWLQYWLFFADNRQDRGLLRTGRHEGDWELFQLRLDAAGRPVEATLAQHTWAQGCGWRRLRRDGDAPVVFVANASHALYARPGVHDRPWPDPNDEADGRGEAVRPALVEIGPSRTPWIRWPGRFGGTDDSLVPGEEPSPRGPAFQPDRWDDPGAFQAAEARPCAAGPPTRPWQTAVLVGIALALAGLLLLRRRHLQSRR